MFVTAYPTIVRNQARSLGFLGDASTVEQGYTYVLSFQSSGFGKPTDTQLLDRLKSLSSIAVRRIEWAGGLFNSGLFSDTLQLTVTWRGVAKLPTEQLGANIAAALSKGFIGSFSFQGASDGLPPSADQVGAPPPKDKGIPWGWVAIGGVSLVGLAIALKG